MFCRNCGTELPENSQFCTSCGLKLVQVPNTEKQNSSNSGKNKLFLSIGMLTIAVALLAGVIFLPAGKKEKSADVANSSNDTVTTSSEELPDNDILATAISECENCVDAVNTYIQMMDLAEKDSNVAKTHLDILSNSKRMYMYHHCTAPIIEVENIPYSYRGSCGLYSGQWQGGGPINKGSYRGLLDNTYVISYSGDWKQGLPNGLGELYIEKYASGWDLGYRGQVRDGLRDGKGVMYEYYDNWLGQGPRYRVYESSTFANDKLMQETECITYDANTNEAIEHHRMIGTDDGWVASTAQWYEGELNPEQKALAEEIGAAALIAFISYEVYDIATSDYSYDYDKANAQNMQELETYRANKAENERAIAQQEKEAHEKWRQGEEDYAKMLERKYPDSYQQMREWNIANDNSYNYFK